MKNKFSKYKRLSFLKKTATPPSPTERDDAPSDSVTVPNTLHANRTWYEPCHIKHNKRKSLWEWDKGSKTSGKCVSCSSGKKMEADDYTVMFSDKGEINSYKSKLTQAQKDNISRIVPRTTCVHIHKVEPEPEAVVSVGPNPKKKKKGGGLPRADERDEAPSGAIPEKFKAARCPKDRPYSLYQCNKEKKSKNAEYEKACEKALAAIDQGSEPEVLKNCSYFI